MLNGDFTTEDGHTIPHRLVGNSIRVNSIHNTNKNYLEVYSSQDHKWHRLQGEQYNSTQEANARLKEHFDYQQSLYFEEYDESQATHGFVDQEYLDAKAARDKREGI